MQQGNKRTSIYDRRLYSPCQTKKGYGRKVINKIMQFPSIQLLIILTGIKLEELESFPQLMDRVQQYTSIYRPCCTTVFPIRTIWWEKSETTKRGIILASKTISEIAVFPITVNRIIVSYLTGYINGLCLNCGCSNPFYEVLLMRLYNDDVAIYNLP